jgi:small multidrug resistance pump
MNAYALLGGAIVCETMATTAMKASQGFSKTVPSVICVLGYAVSFYLLAQTLKHMPTGVAYAIWSGVGIVLISLAAWALHGQRPDLPTIAGMGLIVSGVAVINMFSKGGAH